MGTETSCNVGYGTLRAVVWDFNGTLVDDVDLAVAAINAILKRRDLAALGRNDYRRVFQFPLETYYENIGLDMTRETLPGLADEFHSAYGPGLMRCRLQPGVSEVLDFFRRRGTAQFVLSALEEASLHEALAHLGIADVFTAAYGLDHRLAGSKVARGGELVRDHGVVGQGTLLIGDTHHDAEVADALGMACALVAQGHQSLDRLAELGGWAFADFTALHRHLLAIDERASHPKG